MTLRLDYLSPLPPVRSGISDYSVDLLPHLRRIADVRVLRLPDLPLDEEIARRFEIRDEAGRAGEDGRLPLYQMGNNHYHLAVYDVAMRQPGVVVLHDLILHHFLLHRTVGQDHLESYRRELESCHGWIGAAAAAPVRWGLFGRSAQFELPANRRLLERNRGVIVHGRWAAERLAEDDPRLAVRQVPMGIPLPPAASRERGLAFRRNRGIPDNLPLLGSFGFQTPIKRTDVAIRALARPALRDVHLLIAGELSEYALFEELAVRLGVQKRVHITGFLPFAEFDEAIAATDLCLNLRYPSAGETSASLLRILAVGRPVVVSQYAEFAELPAEVAIQIPLGDDEEELFEALVRERLLAGEAGLAEMGQRARDYIATHHDPQRAALAMADAVTELARCEPPGEGGASPPPNSSLTTSRAGVRLAIAGRDGWRQGERRELLVTIENQSRSTWLESRAMPGGILVEVQLWVDGIDVLRSRPWLALQTPLAAGQAVQLPIRIRRPLGAARLLIRLKIATELGHQPFGDRVLDEWL